MPRRPTAVDVARLAGVSRSAVSMVVNNRADGNVAPEAQDRVRHAMRELGYVPHSVGRSLQSQRTNTIGLVTDEIVTSPFAGSLVSGASAAARDAGMVVTVTDTEGVPGRDAELAADMLHRNVDGLLFASGGLTEFDPPAGMVEAPTVLANCYDPGQRLPAVIPDEIPGTRRAVEHLLDLGHRDLLLLRGTDSSPATSLRQEGFDDGVRNSGAYSASVAAGWEIRDGWRATAAVFAGPNPPTAVVASNDRTAVGVILAATAAGLRVPQDVSVVGVDDQPQVAEQMVPPLTTVALPHRAIGHRAVELLVGRIRGDRADNSIERVECPLVVRSSTGPAPTHQARRRP